MRWLALIVLATACGDDPAGGGPDAAPGALTESDGTVTAQVTGLKWGANSDCPAAGVTVISVTIQGFAAGGGGIGLCFPRPDLIGSAPIDLGDATLVRLDGSTVIVGGCTLVGNAGAKPTGTVTFTGFSTATGASYQIALAGQVAGKRGCGDAGPAEDVTLSLGGTALVTAR